MSSSSRIDGGGLAKLVERQMRHWELAKSQRGPEPRVAAVEDFITVSRQVGAGGSEVASELAERLAWPLFDRDILREMAGEDSVREQIYSSMDERDLGWLEEALRSTLQTDFVKNDYFHQLSRTILALVRQGPAVFLGRAADLILPRDRGFRLRIIAPREKRAARYAARHGLSLPQSLVDIDRIEQQRAEFIRHHFHIEAAEQTRHDLIINLDRIPPHQAVEWVLAAKAMRNAAPAVARK